MYQLLFENWRQYLKEDVFGNLATVFHRTHDLENIPSILYNGFDPGQGDMYGKGLYTVYDLNVQNDYANDSYGDYIIKFKVNIGNYFLILDYDIAKKVFGEKYTLKDQFIKFNILSNKTSSTIPVTKFFDEFFGKLHQEKNADFTSDVYEFRQDIDLDFLKIFSDDVYYEMLHIDGIFTKLERAIIIYFAEMNDGIDSSTINYYRNFVKSNKLSDIIKKVKKFLPILLKIQKENKEHKKYFQNWVEFVKSIINFSDIVEEEIQAIESFYEFISQKNEFTLKELQDFDNSINNIFTKQYKSLDDNHVNLKSLFKSESNTEYDWAFRETDNRNKRKQKTSKIAYNLSHNENLINKINGLVFSGDHDGKVLVGYDPDAFTMLAWGKIDEYDEEIGWHKDINGAKILRQIKLQKGIKTGVQPEPSRQKKQSMEYYNKLMDFVKRTPKLFKAYNDDIGFELLLKGPGAKKLLAIWKDISNQNDDNIYDDFAEEFQDFIHDKLKTITFFEKLEFQVAFEIDIEVGLMIGLMIKKGIAIKNQEDYYNLFTKTSVPTNLDVIEKFLDEQIKDF